MVDGATKLRRPVGSMQRPKLIPSVLTLKPTLCHWNNCPAVIVIGIIVIGIIVIGIIVIGIFFRVIVIGIIVLGGTF